MADPKQHSDCSDKAGHRNQGDESELHELALRIPSLIMSKDATGLCQSGLKIKLLVDS